MAKYICKNFGACGKADAKEEIDVLPGTDAKCSECGATLYETGKVAGVAEAGAKPKWLIPAFVAGLALLGGGGWYAYSTYVMKPVDTVREMMDTAKTAVGVIQPTLPPQEGPRPDEDQIQALKQESETGLLRGGGASTEAASRRAVALEMVKTAIAHLSQGNVAQAEKELNAALERAPDEPLVHYNLAVVRIKQQRMDDAFHLLDTAFAKGFQAVAEMERDPDLAPLRKDARYKALVSKHRQGG